MTRPLRALVGSIGQAGHALPAMALARRLRERGHEVAVQTSPRWDDLAAQLDLATAGPSPELDGASVAAKVRELLTALREYGPDVVVGDALTLTTGLAAEAGGIPRATLLPEVYPVHEPGLPPFATGVLPPRTPLGAAAWRAWLAAWRRLPRQRRERRELNDQRQALGLPPLAGFHGPLGEHLTLVATFPQLEYPRTWPPAVHVTGPMLLDPFKPDVELPRGDDPLVLVAPSTVKDPGNDLVRTALDGLGGEPVRIVASLAGANGAMIDVPPNAVVADWVSYERFAGKAAVVICNGNHGSITWALAAGVPVLVSPAMADDAEHGARVAWSGAGAMIPARLLTPETLCVAVRRMLGDERFARRAREIAAWAAAHDGPTRAAELVEREAAATT